jgi:hypothetical protein
MVREEVMAAVSYVVLIVGALACLALQGCATEQFWHTDMPGYAAPVKVVRVASASELSRYCHKPLSADGGCAYRLDFRCQVYLGPQADACAESHEVNGHCKGRNHKRLYGIVQECAYE